MSVKLKDFENNLYLVITEELWGPCDPSLDLPAPMTGYHIL